MNIIEAKNIRDLRSLKEEFGDMSSDDALELAIEFDAQARLVGPFDPAFPHFAFQHRVFMRYAELLCLEESSM